MDEKIRKVQKGINKAMSSLVKADKKRDKVVAKAHQIVSKHQSRGR